MSSYSATASSPYPSSSSSASPYSHLKVSVAWETPTTYAGEELRCTITFRNTAPDPSQARNASSSSHSRPRPAALSSAATGYRSEWSSASNTPRSGRPSVALADASKRPGHRQTVSLNAPSTRRLSSVPNTPTINEDATVNTRGSRTPKQSHKRSISIVSHGSVDGGGGGGGEGGGGGGIGKETIRLPMSPPVGTSSPKRNAHTRAASYHGPPSKAPLPPPQQQQQGQNGMLLSPKFAAGSGTGMRSPRAPPLVRAATAGAAKTLAQDYGAESTRSPLLQTNEEEDVDSVADDASQTTEAASAVGRSVSAPLRQRPFPSPLPYRDKHENAPLQRVISPLGAEATPRSSVDLMSNFSEDTFASEYVQSGGGMFRFASQRHSRQISATPSNTGPVSENLMMGYVQLQGSFVLDGSLVDLAPFEEVKQMGVIGGQGSGGVVGVGTPKRNSGIFGSLGLSSLGSSFGGILGGQEMSSMKEMKGLASTKSIPLLSTPQAILFVDLELRPGQSRSFTYMHRLPPDLPPTHRGRAIKIDYQLTIGTQRAQTVGQKNNMRQVEIPFRVFPGILENGSLITHDLMEPHVLLRDQASTTTVEERKPVPAATHDKHASGIRSKNAFLAYTDRLMQSALNDDGEALLSPTEARRESRILLSTSSESLSSAASRSPNLTMPIRDLIEQTVTRPMTIEPSSRSPNQFSIQRAGLPVAVISLVRPAYRLGETVTAVVDLTPSATHIFALHASLESEELVAEPFALRSEASIRRATRKVHGHGSEATASQRRAVFRFMVPWNATPDFATSGVRLEWRLRVEFVCSLYPKARRVAATSAAGDGDGSDGGGETAVEDFEDGEELLEEVSSDDRGTVQAALQEVHCESFEVAVPLRVFGADGGAVVKTGATTAAAAASSKAAPVPFGEKREFSI